MKVTLDFDDIQKWLEDNGHRYILHRDDNYGGYEHTVSKVRPPTNIKVSSSDGSE